MSATVVPGVALEAAPPPPRVVECVVVKRNLPLAGRSYGHWWVEMDANESYGWWPARSPLRTREIILGGPGVLNGGGATFRDGPPRDPNHGLVADHEFHPVLLLSRTDDEVRDAIRRFASTFAGEWRYSLRPSMNCRLFQLALLDAAGLVDGTGNYHTRGAGCPALAPLRRVASRLTGRRYWQTNLPAPGRRAVDVLAEDARLPSSDPQPLPLASS